MGGVMINVSVVSVSQVQRTLIATHHHAWIRKVFQFSKLIAMFDRSILTFSHASSTFFYVKICSPVKSRNVANTCSLFQFPDPKMCCHSQLRPVPSAPSPYYTPDLQAAPVQPPARGQMDPEGGNGSSGCRQHFAGAVCMHLSAIALDLL